MRWDDVFGSFIEESPVSVMFRATFERILSPQRMDEIFARAARRQRQGELLFSTCVDLMTLVVTKVRKSVHAAHGARREEIGVSVASVYNKLAGIETGVSEHLVRETAGDLAELMRAMKMPVAEPLPGYEVMIVDGNHLGGTEHRLKPLRRTRAAALPGLSLCILDPQRHLIADLIACEDGHANERSLTSRLLEKVKPGQCWVADRNFCTFPLLFGFAARQAFFVVRQHGQVAGELLGERKKIGRGQGGALYEQKLRLTDSSGPSLVVRRITVELDEPTRFGESELHLLTNLPDEVPARQVVCVYRDRWSIEAAFMHLSTVLRSELNTLGYPEAALFGFAIGVLLYNVLAMLQGSLRAAHPEATEHRKLSFYYLGDEISGVYRGMMIAIPPAHWTQAFAAMSYEQFADFLRHLAQRVKVRDFFTNKTSAKRRPASRTSGNRGNHVATSRLLHPPARRC